MTGGEDDGSLPSERREEKKHVVIVGGGLAGLAAAAALAERGVRVTILESRPSLGGRTSSFVDAATAPRTTLGP